MAFPSRLLEEKEGVSKAWHTLDMPSSDSLVVGLKLYTRVLSLVEPLSVCTCVQVCACTHTRAHTLYCSEQAVVWLKHWVLWPRGSSVLIPKAVWLWACHGWVLYQTCSIGFLLLQ